jgi:hypothetical protein
MTVSVWVPVFVAIVGAFGGILAQRASTHRAKKFSPIDDAAKVTSMARQLASDIREDLKNERQEREALEREYRSEVVELRKRVARLEAEVVRLGGDPTALSVVPVVP